MNGVGGRVVLWMVLVVLLGACRGSAEPVEPPTSHAGPYSTPPPSIQANPRTELRTQAELDATIAALPPALGFTVSYTGDGAGRFLETHGSYRAPDRWRSRTEVRVGAAKPYVLHTRSIGTAQWMQMDDWVGRNGYWMSLAPDEVPIGYLFMSPGRPVPIELLDEISRTRRGYAVPYHVAVRLVSGQLVDKLRLAEIDDPQKPVEVRLRFLGDTLSDVTLFVEDLFAALPPRARRPGARPMAESLTVVVGLDESGPVRVTPPPAESVFTEDERTCRPPVA